MRRAAPMLMLCALPIACSSARTPANDEPTGSATAAVTLAPDSARCVVVTVTPASTVQTVATTTAPGVTQSFDLAPETSTVFSLQNLPLGSDTFSAQAFPVDCADASKSTPTWISDSVTATVSLSSPVAVSLEMQQANQPDAGGATVGVDFPTSTSNAVSEFQYPAVAGHNALLQGPLAVGSDGNLWFGVLVEGTGAGVAKMTTGGLVTNFLSLASRSFMGVAAGPDGNVWLSGPSALITRVTPSGEAVNFLVGNGAFGIAAGPDDAMWFGNMNSIGRITVGGATSQFALPANLHATSLLGITTGPDGNIWFADPSTNSIGQMTTAGAVTQFQPPSGLAGIQINGTGFPLAGIASGPDGNLWFAEQAGIGRITTGGGISEFPIPTANGRPLGVAAGPDGNVWFTEYHGNQIGRITPAGEITEFPLESANSQPCGITSGPDGALWFTQVGTKQIGRITP